MSAINLIFPDQLFEKSPLPVKKYEVFLVEEFLYFKQYKFHKQKIAFHRGGMRFYEDFLKNQGAKVSYIDYDKDESDVQKLIQHLKKQKVSEIYYIEPVDDWLERRLEKACRDANIKTRKYDNPKFLNTTRQLEKYFSDRKKFFQTDFYIDQRKSRDILIDKDNKPIGGKWSFDAENRKKYPKGKKPPAIKFPEKNDFQIEANAYVEKFFADNYGQLTKEPVYPVTFEASRKWLKDFLKVRFSDFGAYEDAIVARESILHHSVLSPLLNAGLLTPDEILETTLEYASENEIPINSLEGFIRQITGWREFIRAIYQLKGREERTRNFWGFSRKIPSSFYDGSTGIPPLDIVIKKVLDTAYCHHIERLMVLGNFMILCEFDPDDVYQWFMEMFIDAYDWVMVPNVYGMSQFADGGIFATKPYISGSNYLMKMSDFEKGEWQKIWDGLFWRFMDKHREFFNKNPRMGMLVKSFDKMPEEKRNQHLKAAEEFLEKL
ncbi:MAG: cryptochrome/photolyase family protein [Bacteroidetes bacterium]|nr:MAG: cryptochrome/photolyase family protein [Bacteroidota bacterium]